MKTLNQSDWWIKHYKNEIQSNLFENQNQRWKELCQVEPGFVRSGLITAITVRDPRVTLPKKRDGVQMGKKVHIKLKVLSYYCYIY